MSLSMHHTQINAAALINSSLNPITSPPSPSPPIAVSGVTTAQWAIKNLGGVTLSRSEKDRTNSWDWTNELHWHQFQSDLEQRLVDSCIPGRMFQYPSSEGDVVSIVDAELLNVVYRVGKHWLPNPPSQLEWQLEVLSEAYAKAASPEDIGGVRVDKIFVASASRAARITRHQLAEATQEGVKSKFTYIPRDLLWRPETGSSGKYMGSLKGLVAVEIKNLGILDDAQDFMNLLAKAEQSLADSTEITQARGIVAVLQQGLRYAGHYGVRYVFLSDHRTGVMLDVPNLSLQTTDQTEEIKAKRKIPEETKGKQIKTRAKTQPIKQSKGAARTNSGPPRRKTRVQWAVVDGKYSRMDLAYMLWLACEDLRPLVETSSSTTPANPGQAKAK